MTERTLGTFRIDKAQWEAFQGKAKERGSNASSLITGWIEAYLDDSIDNGKVSIDTSIDNIDERIDNRIDTVFLSVQERLDKLEQELEKFAA
jgi:flagellar biosynthesis/type III secretory pathway protein FliH